MSSYSAYSESETDLDALPQRPKSDRKRIIRTREDESSADEAFWKLDIFQVKEENEDKAYSYQRPGRDVSDSDISENVSNSDHKSEEGAIADEVLFREERKQANKAKNKGVYKDPLLVEKRPRKQRKRRKKETTSVKREYAVRKSTAIQSEAAKKIKLPDLKRKKRVVCSSKPRDKFSQEFLLNEAKMTEEKNIESLKKLVEKEDLRKKKGLAKKKKMKGAYFRYHSDKLNKRVTFYGKPYEVIQSFKHKKRDIFYPEEKMCAFSKKRAIYRDPNTLVPFRTIEAFKNIKEKTGKRVLKKVAKNKLFRPSFVIKFKKPAGWSQKSRAPFSGKFDRLKSITLITRDEQLTAFKTKINLSALRRRTKSLNKSQNGQKSLLKFKGNMAEIKSENRENREKIDVLVHAKEVQIKNTFRGLLDFVTSQDDLLNSHKSAFKQFFAHYSNSKHKTQTSTSEFRRA